MTDTTDNRAVMLQALMKTHSGKVLVCVCSLNLTNLDFALKPTHFSYSLYISSGFSQANVKCLCKY